MRLRLQIYTLFCMSSLKKTDASKHHTKKYYGKNCVNCIAAYVSDDNIQ